MVLKPARRRMRHGARGFIDPTFVVSRSHCNGCFGRVLVKAHQCVLNIYERHFPLLLCIVPEAQHRRSFVRLCDACQGTIQPKERESSVVVASVRPSTHIQSVNITRVDGEGAGRQQTAVRVRGNKRLQVALVRQQTTNALPTRPSGLRRTRVALHAEHTPVLQGGWPMFNTHHCGQSNAQVVRKRRWL